MRSKEQQRTEQRSAAQTCRHQPETAATAVHEAGPVTMAAEPFRLCDTEERTMAALIRLHYRLVANNPPYTKEQNQMFEAAAAWRAIRVVMAMEDLAAAKAAAEVAPTEVEEGGSSVVDLGRPPQAVSEWILITG